MDFTLTEEQDELRGLARQILSDRMDLGRLRALDDSTDWFDRDTWAELAKANLLGVALPESVGGLGFDFLEQCLILQEQGRVVGTYFLRANQAGGGAHVANCGYMTDQAAAGRGIARRMCEHSLQHARSRGYRAMQFNFVVSTNERAVSLWKALGFEVVIHASHGTPPG